eukprot:Lankesteria_metandrocarpae@DN3249_c0_g1_i2.p1
MEMRTMNTPQGQIHSSTAHSTTSPTSGTLDEPIKTTIMRDLNSIQKKLQYVLLPRARTESGGELKQWDLWGPLILCLFLSIVLWLKVDASQKRIVFSLVFILIWIGSMVVTANAILLSGTLSFFQSVCVLGYCIFPLDIAALICYFIPAKLALLKLFFILVAWYWATGASVAFMSEVVPTDRKWLAVYPVFLLYLSIGWIILLV